MNCYSLFQFPTLQLDANSTSQLVQQEQPFSDVPGTAESPPPQIMFQTSAEMGRPDHQVQQCSYVDPNAFFHPHQHAMLPLCPAPNNDFAPQPPQHVVQLMPYGSGICYTPPAYFYRPRGPPPDPHPAAFCPPAVTLESRIYEMNKRLQQRSDDPDQSSLWWDAFADEFFDLEAQLTLRFSLEDGPKRYTIGRTLIPRYFRSVFDGGVKDLHYVLRHPCREFMTPNGVLVLECDNALMVTRHDKPMFTEVFTDGRLLCEFTCEEPFMPRIRHWFMEIRAHQEFVPRGALNINQQDPTYQDQLTKNITRQGMTSVTLNYLRLCVILEPMQQLMSQHKSFNAAPRECLRNTLFQKFHATSAASVPQQRAQPPMVQPIILPPEEPPRPPPKRKRSRKGSQSGGATPTGSGSKKKSSASPAPTSASFAVSNPQVDVMVVSEPSLMGGEYGEEDERRISRLENTQFDPTAMAGQAGPLGPMPGPGGISGPPMEGPMGGANFDPTLAPWPLPRGGGPGTPQTPTSRTVTPQTSGSSFPIPGPATASETTNSRGPTPTGNVLRPKTEVVES